MPNTFRIHTFDPALTTMQILSYQTASYLTLSIAVLMVESLSGTEITLDHILNWKTLRLDSVLGWFICSAFVINAAICSIHLLLIVQRTRQCLDFAATFYGFHLILSSIYSGSIPQTLSWWILIICCIAISAVGGEYLCYQQELQPIVVGGGSGGSGGSGNGVTAAGMRRKTSGVSGANDFEMQRLTTSGNHETQID